MYIKCSLRVHNSAYVRAKNKKKEKTKKKKREHSKERWSLNLNNQLSK